MKTGYATVDPFAVGEYAEFDQILTEGMRVYRFLNSHPEKFSLDLAWDAVRNLDFVRTLAGDHFTDMTRFEAPPWEKDFDWGHIRPPEGMLDFGSEWFGPGDVDRALGTAGLSAWLGMGIWLLSFAFGKEVNGIVSILLLAFFLGGIGGSGIMVPPLDYISNKLLELGAPQRLLDIFSGFGNSITK